MKKIQITTKTNMDTGKIEARGDGKFLARKWTMKSGGTIGNHEKAMQAFCKKYGYPVLTTYKDLTDLDRVVWT
jgi:hypothetical protein